MLSAPTVLSFVDAAFATAKSTPLKLTLRLVVLLLGTPGLARQIPRGRHARV